MFCPLCGDKIDDSQYLKHVADAHSPEEMQDFMQSQQHQAPAIPEITVGPNFCKIYATRFNISYTDYDLRLDLLNERRIHPPGSRHQIAEVHEFISESQIIIHPSAAKILVQHLSQAVQDFEKKYGEIKVLQDQ